MAEFDAADGTEGEAPGPDYNVAPTKPVLTVVDRGERMVMVMRWGLVPHWAKSQAIGSKMINARSESAASKPAFKTALAKRRCLLPAAGWYEWRREGTSKQPFFMTGAAGGNLAMAGIWAVWHDPEAAAGSAAHITCAVLTTGAVGPLRDIHERMPLLLAPEAWQAWLDPGLDEVPSLLAPPSEDLVGGLELRPVSSEVNNVRNNGPSLLTRATDPAVPDLDELTLFEPERAP